jgi:hypothetical protein
VFFDFTEIGSLREAERWQDCANDREAQEWSFDPGVLDRFRSPAALADRAPMGAPADRASLPAPE